MTKHVRMDPRRVVDTAPVSASVRTVMAVNMSCVPVPIQAQKTVGFSGNRNTSPEMSFQPDFSWRYGMNKS